MADAPLALRLAPGFVKGVIKLMVPLELRPLVDPALDAMEWSVQATAELTRGELDRRAALDSLRALSGPQISSMLAALQKEGAALSDAQAAVVSELLGTALGRAQLSRADALVALDLSIPRVHRALRAGVGGELAGLDGVVLQAAERLLLEGARALCETASKRPGFDEAFVARLLPSIATLSTIANDARRARIAAEAHLAPADGRALLTPDASFRFTYLRASALRTAFLRHPGLPVDSVPSERASFATAIGPDGPSSFPELVANHPRLLLLADAGAGKSTRLVSLAHRYPHAATSLPEGIRARVPFFLPLRALAGKPFPNPRGLLALATPNLADEAPRGWAQRAFRDGAILLFDGLDEVPRSQRREVLTGIAELGRDFPEGQLCIVLSGRPGSILAPDGHPFRATHGWTRATLAPLGAPARDELVRTWHDYDPDADDPIAARARADGLCATLSGDPALDALSRNPLLAGFLCAAHRGSIAALPLNRATLCIRAVESLLRRSFDDAWPVSVAQRHAALSAFALWLHHNEPVAAPLADADVALGRIAELVGVSLPGAEFRHGLVDNSGLLRQEGGTLSFTHRALQHALAAQDLLASGSRPFLARIAHREDWRGVVEDALALASAEVRDDLRARLRAEAARHPKRAQALAGLLDHAG